MSGESHGQKSLAVYSPWVAESDMTEPLTLSKNNMNTKVINIENRLVIARDQDSSTGNGANGEVKRYKLPVKNKLWECITW